MSGKNNMVPLINAARKGVAGAEMAFDEAHKARLKHDNIHYDKFNSDIESETDAYHQSCLENQELTRIEDSYDELLKYKRSILKKYLRRQALSKLSTKELLIRMLMKLEDLDTPPPTEFG